MADGVAAVQHAWLKQELAAPRVAAQEVCLEHSNLWLGLLPKMYQLLRRKTQSGKPERTGCGCLNSKLEISWASTPHLT